MHKVWPTVADKREQRREQVMVDILKSKVGRGVRLKVNALSNGKDVGLTIILPSDDRLAVIVDRDELLKVVGR